MTRAVAFNPFAGASTKEIETLLLATCSEGLSRQEYDQLLNLVNILVPALVELRDAGSLELNARAIVEYATLEGLMRLSVDSRLSERARAQCKAVRDRLMVDAVHPEVIRRWIMPLLH